jgi:hypothetical protein
MKLIDGENRPAETVTIPSKGIPVNRDTHPATEADLQTAAGKAEFAFAQAALSATLVVVSGGELKLYDGQESEARRALAVYTTQVGSELGPIFTTYRVGLDRKVTIQPFSAPTPPTDRELEINYPEKKLGFLEDSNTRDSNRFWDMATILRFGIEPAWEIRIAEDGDGPVFQYIEFNPTIINLYEGIDKTNRQRESWTIPDNSAYSFINDPRSGFSPRSRELQEPKDITSELKVNKDLDWAQEEDANHRSLKQIISKIDRIYPPQPRSLGIWADANATFQQILDRLEAEQKAKKPTDPQ